MVQLAEGRRFGHGQALLIFGSEVSSMWVQVDFCGCVTFAVFFPGPFCHFLSAGVCLECDFMRFQDEHVSGCRMVFQASLHIAS